MKNSKRNEIIRKIIGIVLLVAGFCIAAYPFLANHINSVEMQKEIQTYEDSIHSVAQKTDGKSNSLDGLYKELKNYNEQLAANGQHFNSMDDYASFSVDLTKYGLTRDLIGVVEIPKINEKLPLYLGTENDNMYRGVSVVGNTSAPIGGINTNCLISGHRGYVGATMFRHIDEIEVGDKVYIRNPWGVLTYEAEKIEIVDKNAIEKILIKPGSDLVTLMSCHPYRINNQRYLVVCKRV